ncbi:MAG: helix-turn-helix domain-containing protein [Planctomycetota bacterium]|jgi:excisionase family DNA binding protein
MIMKSHGGSLPGPQDVYTTAEAAKLCRVHKNTVIAAINRGLLRSMKTPGGHNRVARHDLLEYMRRSGISVPEWADPPPVRVLIVGEADTVVHGLMGVLVRPKFDVRRADNLFAAGRASAAEAPACLIVDAAMAATGFGGAAPAGIAVVGLHDGDAGSHDPELFTELADRRDVAAIEAAVAAAV